MGLADICRIGTLKIFSASFVQKMYQMLRISFPAPSFVQEMYQILLISFSALGLSRICTKFNAFHFSVLSFNLGSTKYSFKKKLRSERSTRKEKKIFTIQYYVKPLQVILSTHIFFSFMLMTLHDSSHSESFTPSSATVFLVQGEEKDLYKQLVLRPLKKIYVV